MATASQQKAKDRLNRFDKVFLKVDNPDSFPHEWGIALERGNAFRVGRGSRNEIVLLDPAVSREHLLIAWTDGALTAQDLRSKNGSRINENPLLEPVSVDIGDCLELGTTSIRVLAPDDPDLSNLLLVGAKEKPSNPEVGGNSRIQRILEGSKKTPQDIQRRPTVMISNRSELLGHAVRRNFRKRALLIAAVLTIIILFLVAV